MEFNSNKAIYLQISDMICEQILSGALAADDRIPSVREYGASVGVNPNTVMRTYEKLTNEGIIYNKRGIGYFISAEAKDIVLENNRKEFLEVELPAVIKKMELLGLDEVFKEYTDCCGTGSYGGRPVILLLQIQ